MEAQVIITTEIQLKAFIADAVAAAFKHHQQPIIPAQATDEGPNGDFNWLYDIACGRAVPKSTLRIKSAAGLIPGAAKVGKRVIYNKALVLAWLRSNPVTPIDTALIERNAEAQVDAKISKRATTKAA